MNQSSPRIVWAKDLKNNLDPIPGKPYSFTIPEMGSLGFGLGGTNHSLGYTIQPLRPESGVEIDISNNNYLIMTLKLDRYSGIRFAKPLKMYIDWNKIRFLTFG